MEIIILLCSLILGSLLFFAKKMFPNFKLDLVVKILAIVYFAVGFIRLFLPDDFILIINGAYDYGIYFDSTDYLSSFLRWGYQTSLLILPIVAFFPKNIHLRRIVTFYCLPMLIANIFIFDKYMDYFLTREVLNIRFHDPFNFGKLPDWVRYCQFVLEIGLATTLATYFSYYKKIYKLNLKEFGLLIAILIPVILLSLPIYVPQSLFGYGNLKLTGFTLQNYIWIIFMFVVTYAAYVIFRFQSYENRYITCLFLALALFVLYNSFYITGITIPRLPIQLCNLACYLLIITIIFKWQWMFDFVLIANIVGTIVAILVPDVEYGVFSFFHFHFLYEHMLVLIVPILMLVLRIFKRPDRKTLRNALIGFSMYFVLCWISGTYLNSISDKTGYTVNYFYIFDDEVVTVFPFLSGARNIKLVIGNHVGYPLFQFIVYCGFSGFCVAFYYILKWFIKVGDDHFFLRKINIIEREEKLGRKLKIKKDYDEEGGTIDAKN